MDVNSILLDILIVLVAAKIAAEIADRIGLPAVVAEIGAGILVGPSVLGVVEPNEVLHVLAELGVILLLFEVGLEMDLRDLRSVGRASLLVGVVGVAVPLAAGAATGLGLGFDGDEALFVGAALTATSVGITARVFGDLRALATVEARTVLGAAVADDVLGLVILTVVTRIVTGGGVSAASIAEVLLLAIGFVVVATWVGLRLAPPVFGAIRRHSRSTGTLVVLALAFTLAFSELAHAADLAPIIGAFVAGLAMARTSSAERVQRELAPVGHLLIPVFFLQIGIDVELDVFTEPSVLRIAAVLFAVGVLGKLVSSIGMFGRPGDKFLVGLGMIPRGEVGLIFATLGLREGVFGQDVYGALIIVVLLSTVVTPPALRWRLLRVRGTRRTAPARTAGPSDALVAVDDHGRVVIAGEPLPSQALPVALAAARFSAHHAPSDELLEWFDAFPPGPRPWDAAAREEFLRLLHEGGPRSWRLLTASGVLQRALPELDDALAHTAHDAFDLDPLAGLRFPRLVAVRDALSADELPALRDAVLLAALVLDACEDAPVSPVVVARRTVRRLDLGTPVEQAVAGLVNDAALLEAAARRVDGLAEESVLELAVHLGSAEQARALRLLTLATCSGEEWERERIEQLAELVLAALEHPELTGRDAANEVERRKAGACAATTDRHVRERIMAAPREYALHQRPDDLVRHARLCEPTPGRNDIRVSVEAVDGAFRVEVAARDRIGLVARIARALTDAHCDVRAATVVTWGDGTALSSYLVASPPPDPVALEQRLRALTRTKLESRPLPSVVLQFDDHSSPWHTRCTVEATDEPGLLHALTLAFASAGVSVHAALVATDGVDVVDTFALTDRNGAKLDDAAKERVRAAVARGVRTRGGVLARLELPLGGFGLVRRAAQL